MADEDLYRIGFEIVPKDEDVQKLDGTIGYEEEDGEVIIHDSLRNPPEQEEST